MPDTLANNKINYIHISPILDSILFIPSKESNFISLIAPLSYIKKVMASPNFQKAYYVELLGYSPLDSIVTSFYSSSTLKELSLFISDKKYNYEILSNIKGVEEIHLIDCPCLENLIILNNNKSLKKVSCSNSSRRNAKLLNKSSSKFNFKLVVYNK